MKIQKLVLIVLLSIQFSAQSQAKVQEFKYENDKFSMEVPEGFSVARGLLNVPVTLTSERNASGNRSVIQITPFNLTDKHDVLGDAKKSIDDYVSSKEDWLESVNGESIAFEDYNEDKTSDATFYNIGSTYEVLLGRFKERSQFISTKDKRLFFVKTLIPEEDVDENALLMEEAVKTFKGEKI